MSKDEVYQMGLKKKNGIIDMTWDELNIHCGYPYSNGHSFRKNVEKKTKREKIQAEKELESFTWNHDKSQVLGTAEIEETEEGLNITLKAGTEERTPPIEDCGDFYIVHSVSTKRQVTITKEDLRKLKELYCDDKPMTINQLCRHMNIPRRDFVLIKTAFNITHDDIPFIDEDITDENIEELVNTTLEKRKEKYFITLQQLEIVKLKKELDVFRKKDYFLLKMQDLTKDFLNNTPTIKVEPLSQFTNMGSKLLGVPIMDLHLNKLAWNQETGEDYDSKIASERFKFTIEQTKRKVMGKEFERILFPIGNDFFNIDNPAKTTTGGTPQDSDSRWAKMFMTGVELLTWAITQLEEIAPVYAFLVPGNHDYTTSFYAICSVAMYFKDAKNIIIDTNPQSRKYVWFGNNLIGFTHMDKEGKRLEGNMQIEASEAWGQTKYREWLGGHLHSEQTREVNGIKIRNLSAPTAGDFWHTTSGYVGSIAETQIFTWDKLLGLEEIQYIVIESQINKHVIII
jgi:hypothetical protein